MYDFDTIDAEQRKQMNESRRKKVGDWICESELDNRITNELRFNYGYLCVRTAMYFGQEANQFELYIKGRRIHLAYIGVGPEHRRQGVGARMMETLTGLADKYGYSVDLDVTPKFGVAQEVLVSFYQKFSFEFEGSRQTLHMIRPANAFVVTETDNGTVHQ